ncbi:blue-light-activated histidine kinase [Glacieibacterium frigidum]|nr:PAS domain-containing protein [Glacieibacterium frigidum]
MDPEVPSAARLTPDAAAASSPQGLADRRALALIAVERTLMPMVVTDPRQAENPIVLANKAFLTLTGYSADEVIGRNCRFLQGPDTDQEALDEIRAAIRTPRECCVDIVNYRKDGVRFVNELQISPIHDDDGQLLYFFASQMDVTLRRQAADLLAAEHALLREVDHRAKNALALVQGIVRLSNASDAARYAAAVQGRVDALAAAHGLLAEGHWRTVPLDRLIRNVVEQHGLRRISIVGPAMEIDAGQVQPLALVFHEIATNAARFGSLSVDDGQLAISWQQDPQRVAVTLAESGGPPPAPQRKPGFGLTMIDAIVRRQLGGEVDYDWAPQGLSARIHIPPTIARHGPQA